MADKDNKMKQCLKQSEKRVAEKENNVQKSMKQLLDENKVYAEKEAKFNSLIGLLKQKLKDRDGAL